MFTRKFTALIARFKHFPDAYKGAEEALAKYAQENPLKIPPAHEDVEGFVKGLISVEAAPKPSANVGNSQTHRLQGDDVTRGGVKK